MRYTLLSETKPTAGGSINNEDLLTDVVILVCILVIYVCGVSITGGAWLP